MTTYKPLGNRVLVKRSKAVASKGGILLPESAQEKPKEGVVLAVGPGKLDDAGNLQTCTVKESDRVLFSSYAGTAVQDSEGQDEELLIMAEDEILGVLS